MHHLSVNLRASLKLDHGQRGLHESLALVCRSADGKRSSLSCNPDTSPELIQMLRASGRPHVAVALVNQNLPFMAHDAEVAGDYFDLVFYYPGYTTTLFSTPKLAVTIPH